MKRGGPLKVDAAKARAWQARSAPMKRSAQPVHNPVHKRPVKIARRKNDGPWRAAVIALRGEFCRGCLSTVWLQADHAYPKSQGGTSVVENGLMLCESCHRAKTESRIVIEFAWLDPDQIAWLAQVGWVAWDDDGQPHGRGWRHFGPRTVRGSVKGGEHG